jgi:hypothetical protein
MIKTETKAANPLALSLRSKYPWRGENKTAKVKAQTNTAKNGMAIL